MREKLLKVRSKPCIYWGMEHRQLKQKVVECVKQHGLREVQAALVFEGLAPNLAQKLTDNKYRSGLRELTMRAIKRALAKFEA